MSLVSREGPVGWRPGSASAVCGQLRSRAGEGVTVTAGKAAVFLYAATADGAAAAEGVAREVLALQGLAADVRVDQWDPSRRAWVPPGDAAATELPPGQEGDRGRRRLRVVGAVIAALIEGAGSAS